MSKMEFKGKTETEALEKIANAPLEHHWGCDQILIDGCHFAMSDVQDYAKATLKNQPQLTIPKSIADKLDKDDANNKTVLDWVFATEMIVINDEKELKRREDEILRRRAIVSIYGASKALGVDLVKVVEG